MAAFTAVSVPAAGARPSARVDTVNGIGDRTSTDMGVGIGIDTSNGVDTSNGDRAGTYVGVRARVPARVALLLGALVAVGGCSTAGDIFSVSDVRPWERDVLAREDMQLVPDAMDDAVDDHVYFSKEASTGGGSVRGGGCGCN